MTMSNTMKRHKIALQFAELALLFGVSPNSLVAGLVIASENMTPENVEEYGTITRHDLARVLKHLHPENMLGPRAEHPIDEIMRRYRDALNELRDVEIASERKRLAELNDPAKVEHVAKLIRESVDLSWSPARIVRYIERVIFETCETTTPTTDDPQQPAPVKQGEGVADNPSEGIANPSKNEDRPRATEDTRHGTRSDQMMGDV